MPDFTFTSPQGREYTVTGPEGATKEQAFQVLLQQHPELATPEPKQPAPPPDRYTIGNPMGDTDGGGGAAPPVLPPAQSDQEVGMPTREDVLQFLRGNPGT